MRGSSSQSMEVRSTRLSSSWGIKSIWDSIELCWRSVSNSRNRRKALSKEGRHMVSTFSGCEVIPSTR